MIIRAFANGGAFSESINYSLGGGRIVPRDNGPDHFHSGIYSAPETGESGDRAAALFYMRSFFIVMESDSA